MPCAQARGPWPRTVPPSHADPGYSTPRAPSAAAVAAARMASAVSPCGSPTRLHRQRGRPQPHCSAATARARRGPSALTVRMRTMRTRMQGWRPWSRTPPCRRPRTSPRPCAGCVLCTWRVVCSTSAAHACGWHVGCVVVDAASMFGGGGIMGWVAFRNTCASRHELVRIKRMYARSGVCIKCSTHLWWCMRAIQGQALHTLWWACTCERVPVLAYTNAERSWLLNWH
jgi:hypothetical protein